MFSVSHSLSWSWILELLASASRAECTPPLLEEQDFMTSLCCHCENGASGLLVTVSDENI